MLSCFLKDARFLGGSFIRPLLLLVGMIAPLSILLLLKACHTQNGQGDLRPSYENFSRDSVEQAALGCDGDACVDASTILTLHVSMHESFSRALLSLSFDHQEARSPDFLRHSNRSFVGAAVNALVLKPSSDAARLAFALQLASALPEYRPQAIAIIERLKAGAKTGDPEAGIADILEFFVAQIGFELAQSQSNALDAHLLALASAEAFQRATLVRHSAFYHRAKAGQLLALILAKTATPRLIETFLARYPDYPRAESLRLEQAKLELAAGNQAGASKVLSDIAYDTPWTTEAKTAQALLESEGLVLTSRSFEEDFARLDFLRRKRFWREAEQAVAEARAKYPESFAVRFQEARIPYEQSIYEPSIPILERLYKDLDGQRKEDIRPQLVNAYLESAYAYKGDCATALSYVKRYSEKLGRSDRQRAELKAAYTCGDFALAYQNAKLLRGKKVSAEDNDSFAFLAYLARDYATARQVYAQAINGLSGTYARRAAYFFAQATLKLATSKIEAEGQIDAADLAAENPSAKTKSKAAKKRKHTGVPALPEATVARAKKLFEELIAKNNSDYYAILAYSRLEEIAYAQDPSHLLEASPMLQNLALTSDADLDQIQTDQGKRKWTETYDFEPNQSIETITQQCEKWVSYFPALARVCFLHEARLYKERNAEFRPIAIEAMGITRLSKRPRPDNVWAGKLSVDGHLVDNRRQQKGVWGCPLDVFYFDLPAKKDKRRQAMAERQGKIFDNAKEISAFISDALLVFEDYYLVRRFVSRSQASSSLLYPHAYKRAIIREALANGLSPDLMWTVMNIESAFNHDAISHADAFGLLQIIPMTGYKIAAALGLSDFGPYELIEAEKSIPMGTWYFAQILRKFEGYATLALAGYNGGPHYVARWLTAYAAKVEHDAFVELIPFNEARNYVKKGAARLLIYRRINSGNPSAFYRIPNTMPLSFGEMPNY